LIELGVQQLLETGRVVDVDEVEVVEVVVGIGIGVVVGPLGHLPSLVSPTPVKVNLVVCLQNAINEPLVLLL
jgi:hypothetical protein